MPARILFVEDDAAFHYAAAKALREAGFEVVAAPDYLTALAALDSNQGIDILLTDVVMPKGVNGFALARMARLRRRRLKIIYVTAYDVPIQEAEGTVLRKPIEPEALVAHVKAILAE